LMSPLADQQEYTLTQFGLLCLGFNVGLSLCDLCASVWIARWQSEL